MLAQGRIYMELKRRPFSAPILEIYFMRDQAENLLLISSCQRGLFNVYRCMPEYKRPCFSQYMYNAEYDFDALSKKDRVYMAQY